MTARLRVAFAIAWASMLCAKAAIAQIPPDQRTANMPDSWLVLYNLDPASGSLAWKDWYIQQWSIPPENCVGLNASTAERVPRDQFNTQVFYPVRDFLNTHPDLKAKIMGIVVGYRVPGNFYLDNTHPPLQGGGGWSVSNNLTDMVYTTWYKRSNPHAFAAYANPNYVRLTKAALGDGCYLTARLDAPTLADAQALTLRAKAITASQVPLPDDEHLYYDYLDIGSPAGDDWTALRSTVQSDFLTTPPWRFPWLMYDSDVDLMPSCTMSFSYYRITGWDTVPWTAGPLGSRVFGMAMNSWGATTVRSTTDQGARYVPNALVNGRFAAAAGATAEPYTGAEPNPSTIVWCLAEGRTLGEAFFHANPYRNYMWELVGDPLLTIPRWFANPCESLPPPDGLGPAEFVSGGEIVDSSPTLSFRLADRCGSGLAAFHLQIDRDDGFGSPDVEFVSELLPVGLTTFSIGQPTGNGTYIVGQEGQQLPLGGYYWRVRSEDQSGVSEWVDATSAGPAFEVGEPLVLVRAVSRKAHGGTTLFDIDLALPPYLSPPTVEPRRGGPTQLVLTFNKPITVADGLVDLNDIDVSTGVVDAISLVGNDLVLDLSNVPNQTCLVLSLSGIIDLAGNPVNNGNQLTLRVLEGDSNDDGQVNLTDLALVKASNGQTTRLETARFDINVDGEINLTDMTLAKNDNGALVVCP